MKVKNKSHRQDINMPTSSHGHKYNRFEKILFMMMPICTKQHLSEI